MSQDKIPGLYYFAREANQFTTIESLYHDLGGKFLTWRISKIRFGRPYPFRRWKLMLFPKVRHLEKFNSQVRRLFPGCQVDSVRHFYLGPFPPDLRALICTTMWPVPARSERTYLTFQFYHGVSDKRFKVGGKGREFPPMFDHWDFWMLTGEKDKQKLLKACRANGIVLKPEQLVEIGYLRFDKIINRRFDRAALQARAGIPDNGRKNILFAPTWKWGGGTLMSHYQTFCEQIPREYNLIIRNHINDARNVEVVKAFCRQRQIANVYFIDDSIMNIIDNIVFADLLITDSSSVAYDFLIMDRPMIFNKTVSEDVLPAEEQFNIRRCGLEFDLEKDDILKTIEQSFLKTEFLAEIAAVRANCFYYLDGRATERAAAFIREQLEKLV